MKLKGKKIIVLGERDGVQANSISLCAKSAGAEVVIELTHCFV
jgi:betaine reductase